MGWTKAAVLCFATLAACTGSPVPSAQQSQLFAASSSTPNPSNNASACRVGNPLAHVYAPRRLELHKACTTVNGVVRSVKREPDLDLHIDLKLDAAFETMLNDQNRRWQHGDLVLEIVPADQSICVSKEGTSTTWSLCTGADLSTPNVGERISASGPFVTDLVHGWNEIHPVWGWSIR